MKPHSFFEGLFPPLRLFHYRNKKFCKVSLFGFSSCRTSLVNQNSLSMLHSFKTLHETIIPVACNVSLRKPLAIGKRIDAPGSISTIPESLCFPGTAIKRISCVHLRVPHTDKRGIIIWVACGGCDATKDIVFHSDVRKSLHKCTISDRFVAFLYCRPYLGKEVVVNLYFPSSHFSEIAPLCCSFGNSMRS